MGLISRFGKSAEGILGVRQSFFAENARYLAAADASARIYAAQPPRLLCKLCAAPLPERADFSKRGIGYAICTACGHLNGLFEDTAAFHRAVQDEDTYSDYYKSADEASYAYRARAIYRPKVDFLAEALAADGLDLRKLRVADFGSGCGYLVAALDEAGVPASRGFEVSAPMASFANRMLKGDRVTLMQTAETIATLSHLEADVVCLIGVLEHLQDMRAALDALNANPSVQHVYLCVPMFGPCVYLELAFPNAYPRHLVSDHTHLFTVSSLQRMEAVWGLERRAEWWFGSDMIDLYRFVSLTIEQQAGNERAAEAWRQMMAPLIDSLQLAIDHQRAASECHLVLRRRRP
jgi:hypothetical protein